MPRERTYIALVRGRAGRAEVQAAMDALGIGPGDGFLIAKDRPLTQAEMHLNFADPESRDYRRMEETKRLTALIEEAQREGIDTHTDDNRVLQAGESLGGGDIKFAKESETSRKAALMNYPKRESQRWMVLRTVGAAAQGMTRDDVGAALGWPSQVATPRVLELIEGGWLVETGETRPTRSGAEAAVCKITQKAYDKILEETHG